MKRSVWLLLLMTPAFAWAQVQVTVGTINSTSGAKTIVPVTLSEGQAISAIQFDLAFDTTVLSLPSSNAVLSGELCRDHGIATSTAGGTAKIAVFSGSLSTLRPGTGTIVQLVFDVAPGAAAGKTAAVTLSNVKACDASGATVPTAAVNGAVTVSASTNQPAASQNRLTFPQLANGAVGQGAFYTIIILINETQAPAFARIRFFKSDGTAFPVTVVGQGTGSEFNVTVGAAGSAYLQTDGTGDLAAGYAVVTSTGPVGGTAMFGWRTGAGGTITEAGVGASASETEFSVPVIYIRNVTSTGIAMANPSGSAVQLSVKLKDTSGKTVEEVTVNLAAGQQKPSYVHESALFPSLATAERFSGTLQITAPKGVAVTAVKQTMQEGLITTFPIVLMK